MWGIPGESSPVPGSSRHLNCCKPTKLCQMQCRDTMLAGGEDVGDRSSLFVWRRNQPSVHPNPTDQQKVPVPEPGGLPCPHTFPCTQELWAFKKILSLWCDYFISGLPWKLGREREHGYAEFISPGPNIVSSLRYSWPGTKCCCRGCGLHGLPAAAPYHAFPWCLWLTGVHWEGVLDTPLWDTEPRERHLCKERPEMLLIHSKCRKMHLNVSSAFQMCLSLKIWKLTVLSKEHWRNWRAHIGKNSIIFLHCTGMQCWELNSTLRHA